MKRRILSVVTAILVLGSSSSTQNQEEISVLAWTLSRPALEKLIPQFESKTGYKVNVTWARGPASKERVASGDIFDAAIMTGPIGGRARLWPGCDQQREDTRGPQAVRHRAAGCAQA